MALATVDWKEKEVSTAKPVNMAKWFNSQSIEARRQLATQWQAAFPGFDRLRDAPEGMFVNFAWYVWNREPYIDAGSDRVWADGRWWINGEWSDKTRRRSEIQKREFHKALAHGMNYGRQAEGAPLRGVPGPDAITADGMAVDFKTRAVGMNPNLAAPYKPRPTTPQKLFAPDFNYDDPSIDYLTITRRFRNFGDAE